MKEKKKEKLLTILAIVSLVIGVIFISVFYLKLDSTFDLLQGSII